jgi:helix-turn-helix protein
MAPFGEELRKRRLSAGLSLAALADRVFYTKGYLSKVENGLKPPTADLAARCDAALDAGGALSTLVRAGDAPRRGRPPTSAGTPVHLDPATWAGLPVGPDAGASAGWPGWAGGVGPAGADAWGGEAVSAAAEEGSLPVLAGAFEQARLQGHQFSPRLVLMSVRALAGWVRALADRAADPEAARRLSLLAARFAEYTGWMAQELGDDRAAMDWTRLAVSWAVGAGDAELSWFALIRAADMALYRQDAARIIEVTQLAQLAAPGRVGSVAAQREAQGHALLGDYSACMRALDRAAELAHRPDLDEGPGTLLVAAAAGRSPQWGAAGRSLQLGGTSIADPLAITTGWTLVDLGRLPRAIEILDREVPRIAPVAARSRARYGIRRALAHAAGGNLEHACELLNPLIGDIARADSATIRVDLRRLANELSRWRNHRAVADLLPRLSAVLRGPYGQV